MRISDWSSDVCSSDLATETGLHATFSVDNAEQTSFPDASFDRIGGSGILHHLDLDSAYAEIARLLKPGGRAVFLEPLGHNPLYHAYRDRPPPMRTENENPLHIGSTSCWERGGKSV